MRTPAVQLLALVAALPGCMPAPPGLQAPFPSPTPTITLVGVGDILLGRQLGVEMEKAGDYSLPFQSIAPVLTDADITFGNFEGVFCEKPPWPAEGMVFRMKPERVKSFVAGGFDVVSVANNHFGDGGDACIPYSVELLRANGIATTGAGADFAAAHTPAIIERHGVKFAFLAYTYAERNDQPPPGSKATASDQLSAVSRQPTSDTTRVPAKATSKGANEEGRLKPAPTKAKAARPARPVIAGRNVALMKLDVEAARARADVVIVSLHDGAEYTRRVARQTEEFARAAIDAGATAVLGHHPHVPQRVEQYKGGWIFYSLGNFAFQQKTPPEVRHALIARLTFTGKALAQVEAIPGYIETYARPRLATGDEAAAILKGIDICNSVLWSAANPPAPPKEKAGLAIQESGGMGMVFTQIVALIGAITGIAGFVLGILNYLRDRPKIKVILLWDMTVTNSAKYDPQKLWALVKVTNVGHRPTYVSHAALKLPKGYKHTHLLLHEGIAGKKLSEGDPPETFIASQNDMEQYARDWRKIRAVITDSSGKQYYSKPDKSKVPSWARRR